MIQARIEQNRQTIAQLQALQQRMEHAVATWNTMPDGTPEGESICCLIESIADLCEPHE
jgi:hypothetical protein